MKLIPVLIICLFAFSCTEEKKDDFDFSQAKQKLIPLHKKMGKPANGDWLETHPEKNLSLEEYIELDPVRADANRNKIYIQPIGKFTVTELLLIGTTAKYLDAFFGLETKILTTITDSNIPKKHRRMTNQPVFTSEMDGNVTRQYWKDTMVEQLQTKYILDEILKPNLPKDAVTMIAFCNKDLYPDDSYNYVFGYASLKNRVGVWSFARFGSLDEMYDQVLMRTLKTASHETGHMFSIKHCSRYYCIMNGSNHLDESDSKPTYFCPDCLEKFCWNFKIDPIEYFARVKKFWEKEGYDDEVVKYNDFIKAL